MISFKPLLQCVEAVFSKKTFIVIWYKLGYIHACSIIEKDAGFFFSWFTASDELHGANLPSFERAMPSAPGCGSSCRTAGIESMAPS